MNIVHIRSQMPAMLGAQPAGQQRVCHRWMHNRRARGSCRRTRTYAEVHISRCPNGKLNTGIDRHAPRDRPKSP
jgi:hypothetical protein